MAPCANKKFDTALQATLFPEPIVLRSRHTPMPRADPTAYKSMVSESTPLLERGAGSWWDWRRSTAVATAVLLVTALVVAVLGARSSGFRIGTAAAPVGDSSGMEPMISPIGDGEFGRTLVGVLGTEGLGVAYQTMLNYECLARRLGRKLVLVPLVTSHFDNVPIDLAELFQFDDGQLVPLAQAPHDIMARVWKQYGDGEATNQWIRGGSYGAASVYFGKYLPGVPKGSVAKRGVILTCPADDEMPCVEGLASQAQANDDEELVTVFSDAHFCGIDGGAAGAIGSPAAVKMNPPNEIYQRWLAATQPHFPEGSGLSTLHWRRGDMCTQAQITADPNGREFACADFEQTPIPAMCDKNRPLYIATDDFDPDFQAAIVKAGCLSYPQVFGNVGVTDAFGSFLLDILTMTLRTERTFFVLGGSSDNGMISQLQEFEAGAPVESKEIAPEGAVPISSQSL